MASCEKDETRRCVCCLSENMVMVTDMERTIDNDENCYSQRVLDD